MKKVLIIVLILIVAFIVVFEPAKLFVKEPEDARKHFSNVVKLDEDTVIERNYDGRIMEIKRRAIKG